MPTSDSPDPLDVIEPLFRVDDPAELVALQRALQVALRCEDAEDPAVVGSPIVAALAHRVVDALIAAEERRGRGTQRWRSWRLVDSHPDVLAFVERRKASTPSWSTLAVDARRALVESWIAPLVADATLLDALVG